MSNSSKKSRKILMIPFIFGIIMLCGGIFMLVSGINKFSDAKREYREELAQYEYEKDSWLHNPTHTGMPSHPGFKPNFPGIGWAGIGLLIFSVPVLVVSFTPSFERKVAELHNEINSSIEQRKKDNSLNLFDLITGKKPNVKCDYCGAIMEDGKTKCDSCGAKIQK